MKKLFVSLFVFLSSNIFAQVEPVSINCTIQGVYVVDAKGRLIKVSKSKGSIFDYLLDIFGAKKPKSLFVDAEGSEFNVNRKTGIYSSRFLGNASWKHYVLDYGSKHQSFKVLSTSTGGYMHTQYLQIDTYVEGNSVPFYLSEGSNIFSGVCNL